MLRRLPFTALVVVAAALSVRCSSSPDTAAAPVPAATATAGSGANPAAGATGTVSPVPSPTPIPIPSGPPITPAIANAPHFLLYLGGNLADHTVTRIEGRDIEAAATATVMVGAPTDPAMAIQAPDLSPDRTRVLYVQGPPATVQTTAQGELIVQNVDGTGVRVLSDGANGSPVWSPDGKRIAFLHDGHTLAIMAADGSGRHDVAPSLAVNPHMGWSPDGTKLAVGAGNPSRLAIVDLRAGTFSYVGSTGVQQDNPAWSPDGRELVYFQAGANGLVVANPDGSAARQLTTCFHPVCSRDLEPTWSADGATIAFTRFAPGSATDGAEQIWRVPAAGGDPVQVTSGAEEHAEPSW